jgi:hypothetical protein
VRNFPRVSIADSIVLLVKPSKLVGVCEKLLSFGRQLSHSSLQFLLVRHELRGSLPCRF